MAALIRDGRGSGAWPCLRDCVRQAALRLSQDARLRVVVALPGELAGGAVAQPHVDRRQVVDDLLCLALAKVTG